jgi:predicted nucleotidyltransferase
MDIGEIKIKALKLRSELRKHNIHVDVMLLFGSQARGQANLESDIDLAVVSRDFGKDRIQEGALCNRLAYKIDSSIEVVPLSVKQYLDPNCIFPIVHEIKKNGVDLF